MIEEAIEYFKSNPGYLRLLKGIRNKYVSYGEMKGNVIITNPSLQEREALSGLMKKDYSRNKNISINISKVQEKLDDTRFSGIDLKELLDNYFKEEVFSKSEPVVWECANCGFSYTGTSAVELCPVCKHPKSYFMVKAKNY